jgi:hypothetical protein
VELDGGQAKAPRGPVEAEFLGTQGPGDLDSGPAAQRVVGPSPQLGTGWLQLDELEPALRALDVAWRSAPTRTFIALAAESSADPSGPRGLDLCARGVRSVGSKHERAFDREEE